MINIKIKEDVFDLKNTSKVLKEYQLLDKNTKCPIVNELKNHNHIEKYEYRKLDNTKYIVLNIGLVEQNDNKRRNNIFRDEKKKVIIYRRMKIKDLL